MMYRAANALSEDAVGPWAIKYALLLKLPWLKFVMGCSSYLLSVIALSLRALEGVPVFRVTTRSRCHGRLRFGTIRAVTVLTWRHRQV